MSDASNEVVESGLPVSREAFLDQMDATMRDIIEYRRFACEDVTREVQLVDLEIRDLEYEISILETRVADLHPRVNTAAGTKATVNIPGIKVQVTQSTSERVVKPTRKEEKLKVLDYVREHHPSVVVNKEWLIEGGVGEETAVLDRVRPLISRKDQVDRKIDPTALRKYMDAEDLNEIPGVRAFWPEPSIDFAYPEDLASFFGNRDLYARPLIPFEEIEREVVEVEVEGRIRDLISARYRRGLPDTPEGNYHRLWTICDLLVRSQAKLELLQKRREDYLKTRLGEVLDEADRLYADLRQDALLFFGTYATTKEREVTLGCGVKIRIKRPRTRKVIIEDVDAAYEFLRDQLPDALSWMLKAKSGALREYISTDTELSKISAPSEDLDTAKLKRLLSRNVEIPGVALQRSEGPRVKVQAWKKVDLGEIEVPFRPGTSRLDRSNRALHRVDRSRAVRSKALLSAV